MRSRLMLAALAAAVAACSAPPPTPMPSRVLGTPKSNTFAGMWTGTMQITTCVGPACAGGGISRPFSVTMLDGDRVEALLVLDAQVNLTLEVAGDRQPDGTVRLRGSFRDPLRSWRNVDVDYFDLRVDPLTGLAGDVSYKLPWDTGTSAATARIVSATRRLLDSIRSFDGQWVGEFATTDVFRCEGLCSWTVGRTNRLNLTLTANGGIVGGQALAWASFPVSGPANGVTALLAGQSPTVDPCPNPGFDADRICSESVRNLSMSLDRFGRLTGTVEYARDGWSGSSSSISRYYAIAVKGELLNLIRQ
jgi:hypothetical protein